MRRWFVLLSFIALSVLTRPAISLIHAQEVSPYFYYYSADREAFIVQNSQTDSGEILAEYTIPDACYNYDGCSIVGPGWSPSRSLFVWSYGNNAIIAPEEAHVIVLDASNDSVFQLEGVSGVREMQWSPIGDQLLILTTESGYTNKLYVWNTVEPDARLILTNVGTVEAEWSPNGDYIVAYLSDEIDDLMRVFSPSGDVLLERVIELVEYPGVYPACRTHWSDNNNVIYLDPSQNVVVENMTEGVLFSMPIDGRFLIDAEWDRAGEQVLILTGDECEQIQFGLSIDLQLVSLPNQAITTISSNASPFLPRVFSPGTLFSLSGDQAIVFQSVGTGYDVELWLYDISNNELHEIVLPDGTAFTTFPNLAQWLDEDRLVFYAESVNGRGGIYIYNHRTSQIELITLTSVDYPPNDLVISPNGQYIAFDNYEPCISVCVYDLDSRALFMIQTTFGIGEDVIWHPTQNWLMVLGYRIGNGYRVNVTNITGSEVVALDDEYSYFRVIPSAFGWLPTEE